MTSKRLTIIPALLLAGLTSCQKESSRTNFVIINLDDAGYGDFDFNGAYGDFPTPNISELAREGMRFTHCLAAQPISGPSRCGLMSGCYPNRVNFFENPNPEDNWGLHPDEMTIAELVKQKGYATAIVGKWHLGHKLPLLPLQRGFDEFYGLPYSNDMWPYHVCDYHGYDLPLMSGNDTLALNSDQSLLTTDYTTHAVEFIRKNKGKPFLLYVAHTMPHVPLAVSDKFKGKSGIGLYGDVIMELDWSVGEVLKALRENGIEKRTLVIFTSDNGPWLCYGEHGGSAGGYREGKQMTYEGGNHVPCVMYWKGRIQPGAICNKLISHIDFLPTIAQISGAALPDHKIDGVNILPLIDGVPGANPRESFAYYYKRNDLEAVTDGVYKLVFPHKRKTYEGTFPGKDGAAGPMLVAETKTCELYDLRRDPGERYNVYDSYPEVVERLNRIADQYRADLGDDLRGIQSQNRRPIGRF